MRIPKILNIILVALAAYLSSSGISVYASKRIANEISYTDVGSGKPIVLIHAFPADQNLWQPQRDGLKSHLRVITLDLLGFGKAASVDGKAITMTEYADEVKQLLDQLHIDKAVIGGESMGGYVALAFLEKYPERVSGLILSDTQSVNDSDEARKKREASAVDVLTNGTAGLIKDFLPKALSPAASDTTRVYLKSIFDAQSPFSVASGLRGMALRKDLSQVLAESSLPTLIITGTEDVVISPAQSEAMHRLARNSKLVKISNAGHLSSLEKPDEWNKSVIEFFKNDVTHTMLHLDNKTRDTSYLSKVNIRVNDENYTLCAVRSNYCSSDQFVNILSDKVKIDLSDYEFGDKYPVVDKSCRNIMMDAWQGMATLIISGEPSNEINSKTNIVCRVVF